MDFSCSRKRILATMVLSPELVTEKEVVTDPTSVLAVV